MMTLENKELLLKDLCARLPYKTKICIIRESGEEIDADLTTSAIIYFIMWTVKPYLRPMSSMTEEELSKFMTFKSHIRESECKFHIANYDMIDWLNSHHFDYRGLIEKGLALEAPEGMYKEN